MTKTIATILFFVLVRNAEAYEFLVGDPWGEKTIMQLYDVSENKFFTEAVEILNATPFVFVHFFGGSAFYSVRDEPLAGIAKICNAEKRDWSKISCASSMLHDYLLEKHSAGEKIDCKTFAYSFKDLAAKLDIPGLFVQTEQFKGKFQRDGSFAPHVFNKILVPSDDGQVYAYILDVGFAPDKLFPKTDLTTNRHKISKDFTSLPSFKSRSACGTKSQFESIFSILKRL